VTDTTTALPEGVTSERLEFEGGSINLLRGGEGPPLLYLHGAGGAGFWLPFHGLLAEYASVFAPDAPGFGQSDTLPGVDAIDDLVYFYLELLDRLGLESPTIVGHSFGAWSAAELAVHSPERVGKLVLMSPPGLRIPGHMPLDFFFLQPQELPPVLFHDQASPGAVAMFGHEPSVDEILQIYKDMTGMARYSWHPFINDPKLERRLHRISAPTLVVWPDDDRIVPRAQSERYAQRIPGARLEIVPDCGHAMHMERPDTYNDLVRAFVEGE
jgi:pimeloyl-ACP methyl ester carboxylesterase